MASRFTRGITDFARNALLPEVLGGFPDAVPDGPQTGPKGFVPDTPETPEDLFQQTGSPVGLGPDAPRGFVPDELPDEGAQRPWLAGEYDDRGNVAQATLETASGFNLMLANALGAPVEAINEVVRTVAGRTLEQGGFMPAGDAVQLVRDGMTALGIANDDIDSVFANIGRDTFLSMLSAGVIAAAGPAVASTGVVPRIIKESAETMAAHPGLALGAEAGSAIGGNVGSQIGGPVGGLVGSIAGGMSLGSGTRAARQTLRRQVASERSLIDPAADISDATGRAKEIADRYRSHLDNTIEGIIARVDVGDAGPAPMEAAAELRRSTLNTYNQAQKRATDLWSRVDESKPLGMFTDNVTRLKEGIKADIVDTTSPLATKSLPKRFIANINRLTDESTILDARQIRGEVEAALRQGDVSDTMRRNLRLLSDKLGDAIKEADPYDIHLQEASAYTRWVHDTFTRSPLGQLIERGGKTKNFLAKDDLDAAKAFLRRSRAGQNVAAALDEFPDSTILADSRKFIDNMFRETAEQLGPVKGQRYLASEEVRRFSRQFPEIEAQTQGAAQGLARTFQAQKDFERSAFNRFAGTDPENFGINIYGQANKAEIARDVMRRMQGPGAKATAAREGFKKSVVTGLLERSAKDPETALQLLNRRDVSEMFEAVLSPAEFKRLRTIMSDGAALVRGEESFGPKQIRSAGKLLGTIVGAWAGRRVGTGTIQVPQRFSRASERIAERLTAILPPEELIVQAVINPRVAAYLHGRVPGNLVEMRQNIDQMRKVISAVSATTQAWQERDAFSEQLDQNL